MKMTRLESAKDCIEYARSMEDKCLLMLSYGKDSIVTLDLIYPYFDEIYACFMYFVPNLEHIERWHRWVRAKYPKVHIVHHPHWNLSYILRGGLYCVPNPKIKLITLSDVARTLRTQYGVRNCFTGMKKADGMNRNLMLKGYAGNHYVNDGMCYPLAEWTQKDVLSYMKHHLLPEPIRYNAKTASGGCGFSLDFFLWLEVNCPQDLEKIYAVFPMSRRILEEYHYHQREDMRNQSKLGENGFDGK